MFDMNINDLGLAYTSTARGHHVILVFNVSANHDRLPLTGQASVKHVMV